MLPVARESAHAYVKTSASALRATARQDVGVI